MSVPNPSPLHLQVLHNRFGHSNFRPMQWKIIHTILEKRRDICVVMATGYGKSLCYQYPAVFCNGLGIVISPLISLMQDQILSLKTSNIEASFLGSAQTQKSSVMSDLMNGLYRILYVTPEWCSESGRQFLSTLHQRIGITLVAIDEAHCVSQWGCDFRPDYRYLGLLKDMLSDVPFITVTATATPKVRADICASLRLRNPEMICTDFDRPNLFLSASFRNSTQSDMETADSVFDDFKKLMIKDGMNYRFEGSTIVYCQSRKRTEEVYLTLKRNGIKCDCYHAGLNLERRKKIHEMFVHDELPVIVATVAFGMGIDKPDVRFVIHYGAPKEIESYYQEVGRAGRDGLPSRCHVFYKGADFTANKHFFVNLTGEYKKHRVKMAKLLENYLETQGCRRRLLLSYFQEINEENLKQNKKCCDNCLKSSSVLNKYKNHVEINLEEDAKLLLKAVKYFNGKAGLTKPIQFLRGSNMQFIKSHMRNSELYGKGQKESEIWWKALGRILLRQELLEERSCQPFGGFRQGSSSFPVSVVCITEDGENFLKNGAESLGIRLEPSEELIKHTKTKPHVVRKSSEDIKPASPQLKSTEQKPTSEPAEEAMKESVSELKLQQNLYDALLKTRQTLAFDFHIMPYVVASNLALQALCRNKPKTKQDLMELEGFNEAKVEKFGDAFIKTVNEVIARFSEENADRQWKEAIIKNEPVSPNNVNKVDSGEKWKEAIIKNEPVSPNNVSKVDSGEKAASNQNEVNNETNFQSYFDDEDDDIFKNLDDTDTTNLDVSSMNHKDLQNAVESISPELLKPGKSGIKHEDSQNSKSFLEGDMDLFENFDMPNTNSVGGAPSPTVSLSKLPSSSRGSTTNSSFFSNHDSSNKVSNQVKFTGNVKSSMGKAPPWNGSSKTTVSASSSRLVCKVNTSKRIKYSSDNSSDEESDSVTGKKLPNWLDANAKAEMDKKIKKNSLFK